MKEIKLASVHTTTVDKMVNLLADSYSTIINKKLPIKNFPSVMLWGAPGVGKSQGIRQIAKKIESKTGKTVNITDVRLILFNPIDLRGIPTSNADKTLAVWLKPQIFQMDDGSDVVNILFLDEISSAPQSVQAAAYQITLDRIIGEHKLPENCIVIAAGNRTTDKSVSYKMPKALANRLLHIQIEGDFDSWKKWAVGVGINPKVTGFLSFRSDLLFGFNSENDDLAFATPRTWEMVSNILNDVNDNENDMYPLISGLVGTGTANEFCTWCKVFNKLPSIKDIFEGRDCVVPNKVDELYALISSMTNYAGSHKHNLAQIENSINYARKLPPDFSTVLLKDYMYLEQDYKSILLGIPVFSKWMNEKGRLLNGNI